MKFYQKLTINFIKELYCQFFLLFLFSSGNSTENKIEYKVDNEIITSIDINNEKTLALNQI